MLYKISAVLLLLVLSSCVPPAYLTQEEKEVVYSHNVELTKDKIKTKLMQFVNETFKSSKAVIQTNEDGLLSGNGVVLLGADAFGVVKTYMEFTFMFKYQDNQYKLKCIIKNLYNVDSKSTYDINAYNYGNWKKEIDDEFVKFDGDANKSLTNKKDAFDF